MVEAEPIVIKRRLFLKGGLAFVAGTALASSETVNALAQASAVVAPKSAPASEAKNSPEPVQKFQSIEDLVESLDISNETKANLKALLDTKIGEKPASDLDQYPGYLDRIPLLSGADYYFQPADAGKGPSIIGVDEDGNVTYKRVVVGILPFGSNSKSKTFLTRGDFEGILNPNNDPNNTADTEYATKDGEKEPVGTDKLVYGKQGVTLMTYQFMLPPNLDPKKLIVDVYEQFPPLSQADQQARAEAYKTSYAKKNLASVATTT